MPPKRGKSGDRKPANEADGSWEVRLMNTPLSEESETGWKATLICLVGSRQEDSVVIDLIDAAVKAKSRKLFSVFTKSELYSEAMDRGKGKKGDKNAPDFAEVSEHCKEYLNNNEDVPLPLLAKLIKVKLLQIKKDDKARREAEEKWRLEKLQRKTGGGESDGKKGKKDRGKSPKAKGKKTPEPPTPSKNESKLQKRGEEVFETKFIDDEPDDGTSQYIIMHGFNHPHLFGFLAEQNVSVDIIYKISLSDYAPFEVQEDELLEEKTEKQLLAEADEKKRLETLVHELSVFWRDIRPIIRSTPKLMDLPVLSLDIVREMSPSALENVELKQKISADIYEKLACDIYDLLDWKRQWKNFLRNLKLHHVPLITPHAAADLTAVGGSASAAPPLTTPAPQISSVNMDALALTTDVDMRYYKELMDSIGLEYSSVPLIVNAMTEQVSATIENRLPPSEQTKLPRSDALHDNVAEHFNCLISSLALDGQEKSELDSEFELIEREYINKNSPVLINQSDELKKRLYGLKTPLQSSSSSSYDPLSIESQLQKQFPLNLNLHPPGALTKKASLNRMARLQELLTYAATPGVSKAEIDCALRQLTLESVSLTTVDENGEIVKKFAGEFPVPWDDPYPFYRGILDIANTDEEDKVVVPQKNLESESTDLKLRPESAISDKTTSTESVIPPTTTTEKGDKTKGSAKKERRPRSKTKKGDQKSAVKVEEEKVEIVTPVETPTDSNQKSGILRDQKRARSAASSRDSSVHFTSSEMHRGADSPDNFERESQIMDRLHDRIDGQRRNLDAWVFTEYLDKAVLSQTITEAAYLLPYVDTYYSRRDNKSLVICNNPHAKKSLKNFHTWHSHSHTNVRFRNYLKHVAWRIEEWITSEEAKYEAKKMANESELYQKEFEENEAAKLRAVQDEADNKLGKKARSKSPKAKKKADLSDSEASRSPTPDTSDPFVRQNTIKAYLKEKERLDAEEEENRKSLEEKRSKSAKSRKDKNQEKEDKNKPSKSPKSPKSRKGKNVNDEVAATPTMTTEIVDANESFIPFEGYDLADEILGVTGVTSHMFPSDGTLIRTDVTEFIEGTKSVRTALFKDGHQLMVHIINPKDVVVLGNKESGGESGGVVVEQVTEKSETEKNEKETVIDDGTVTAAAAADVELKDNNLGEVKELPKKPIVGQYASFSATFADGISLAFSYYGKSGHVEGGDSVKAEPYVPPPVRTPTPVAGGGGKESSIGNKKKGNKGKEKDKKDDTELLTARVVATPTASSQQNEPKITFKETTTDVTESEDESFLNLQFSTPNGLVVSVYKKNSAIVVQQQFIQKTPAVETCQEINNIALKEHKRIYTSDGQLVVFSHNSNSTKVLYPDGKLTEYTSQQIVVVEKQQLGANGRNASPPKRDSSPKRKGRKSAKVDETNEIVLKEEWLTTFADGRRLLTKRESQQQSTTAGAAVVENVDLEPLLQSKCFDPDSQQSLLSRDDKTIVVKHEDGTIITEYADATRFTTFYRQSNPVDKKNDVDDGDGEMEKIVNDEPCKLIKIENPVYASVTFDCASGECHIECASGMRLHVFPTSNYELHNADGSFLHIEPNGMATFSARLTPELRLSNPQQPLLYQLRHDSELILFSMDNEGNQFYVTNTGNSTCKLAEPIAESRTTANDDDTTAFMVGGGGAGGDNNRSSAVSSSSSSAIIDEMDDEKNVCKHDIDYYGEHAPRFFVVDGDGNGTELLRYREVANWIAEAESDPNTALILDHVTDQPNIACVSTLIPYLKNVSERWIRQYDTENILPPGLTLRDLRNFPAHEEKTEGPKFGTKAGRGLVVGGGGGGGGNGNNMTTDERQAFLPKCPDKLTVRHVLQYKPLSQNLREVLWNGLKSFADYTVNKFKETNSVGVVEKRTLAEQKSAHGLLNDSSFRLLESNAAATAPADNLKTSLSLFGSKGEKFDKENVKNLYDRTTKRKTPTPVITPLPKRTEADWQNDLKELTMEEENRRLLKERYVPPYFQSDFGRVFFDSCEEKERDLKRRVMKSKGSENGGGGGNVDKAGDGSNLVEGGDGCKSRREGGNGDEINEVEEDTPSPNQGVLGNTPTSIRPTNPTPAMGIGRTSPTTIRPKAPTPVQAKSKWKKEVFIDDKISEDNCHKNAAATTTSTTTNNPLIRSNEKFKKVEDPVRRKIFTAPIAGASRLASENLEKLRGVYVFPEVADFGGLKKGNTYGLLVQLRNTGHDTIRFKIKQPPLRCGIKLVYKPGPIAAGMRCDIIVQIYAGGETTNTCLLDDNRLEVNVDQDDEYYDDDNVKDCNRTKVDYVKIKYDVEITTETNIITLPVLACVYSPMSALVMNDGGDVMMKTTTTTKSDGIKVAKNPNARLLSSDHLSISEKSRRVCDKNQGEFKLPNLAIVAPSPPKSKPQDSITNNRKVVKVK